ncbi:MAG: hypothetical protein IKO47_03005 [Ruminococcus sp.]|nr:hypothetical protein [Ruminococcus sp.]
MKTNEFDIFDNAGDDMIDKISKEYPVLTDEEKERLFAMSERKFNISDARIGDAAVVSGVEHYKRPAWHRFAAMAAAFVLVAGGIGGGVMLSKRMKNTSPDKLPAAATELTTDGTDTTAAETTSAAAVRPGTDYNAVASRLTEEYVHLLKLVKCSDVIQHSPDELVLEYNTDVLQNYMSARYYEVTDTEIKGYEDIYALMRKTFTVAETDKYMSYYCYNDLSYAVNGSVKSSEEFRPFVMINGKLHMMAQYSPVFYDSTVGVQATDITADSFNVVWKYMSGDEERTKILHVVYDEEVSDWRIGEWVQGSYYSGTPSEDEARAAAEQLLSGYSNTFNFIRCSLNDIQHDENDKLVFRTQTFTPERAKELGQDHVLIDFVYYRVTDPAASTAEAMNKLMSKYNTQYSAGLGEIYNDTFNYPEGTVFNFDQIEGTPSTYELTRFINYNGNIYISSNAVASDAPTMKHDPVISKVIVTSPNEFVVTVDEETAKSESAHCDINSDKAFGYYVTREDTGVWRIVHFNGYTSEDDIFPNNTLC